MSLAASGATDDRNLRAQATAVLKRPGYSYLLIENDSLGAEDYLHHANLWHIQLKATRAGSSLYEILP